MLRAAHSLCDDINAERDHERRQELVRELFNKTGDGCHVEPGLACDYGYHIEVGRNFYANYGCVLLDCAKITIGDNVFLAPNVQIYTAGHPLDAVERRTVEFAKPITIGNDCWIGGAAIILPGITIGDRVVIGAGAVVTKDVPDDCVVAGAPARRIRSLRKTEL